MSRFADLWLVRLDRACVRPLERRLGRALLELSAEVGEEFRIARLAAGAGADTLRETGLLRFAMPVARQLSTRGLTTRDPAVYAALQELVEGAGAAGVEGFALRRHGRFAVREVNAWMRERGLAPWPSPAEAGDGQHSGWADREQEHDHGNGSRNRPTRSMVLVAASDEVGFAGVTTPVETGTTRLGGWPALAKAVETPSRAAGKLEEALEWLAVLGYRPSSRAVCLDLGAYPGGMTTALASRGFAVDAVDVRPPIAAVAALPEVRWHVADAKGFEPPRAVDLLVCDMNGPPRPAALAVARMSACLRPGGLIVHTVKLPSWDIYGETRAAVEDAFTRASLDVMGVKHLAANRQEVTLLARKP